MKYNKELLDLSRILYNEMDKKENKDNIVDIEKEDKLIKILLKRFMECNLCDDNNKGLLKTYIKDGFWKDETDPGFKELKELNKEDKLDKMLREYNMYLGKYNYSLNSNCPSYFEIVWDYKTYFENIISSIVSYEYMKDFDSRNRFINSIAVFKTFNEDKQKEIIDIFFDYVLIYLEKMAGIERNDYKKTYKISK